MLSLSRQYTPIPAPTTHPDVPSTCPSVHLSSVHLNRENGSASRSSSSLINTLLTSPLRFQMCSRHPWAFMSNWRWLPLAYLPVVPAGSMWSLGASLTAKCLPSGQWQGTELPEGAPRSNFPIHSGRAGVLSTNGVHVYPKWETCQMSSPKISCRE